MLFVCLAQILMQIYDRRQHPRIQVSFPAKLGKEGLTHPIEAVAENVSQVGAYIKTELWNVFQANERVLATLYLPTGFTGQGKTIALQGEVSIARIDPEQEGVGLRFAQPFRQFDRLQ